MGNNREFSEENTPRHGFTPGNGLGIAETALKSAETNRKPTRASPSPNA